MKAGYTGDGLRAWKQTSAGKVYFLYDGDQPVVEFTSNGTTNTVTAVNTFGADGLLSRHTSGGSVFYSFDPQGNVCQRFNSSATLLSSDEYNAWGALLATTQTGAHDVFGAGAQWGYYTDSETGLLLLTHRYYDPGTGRFLTRDPIGYAGGLNLYGYCGNDPATYSDPSGEIAPLLVAGGIALVLFLESEQAADVVPPGYVHRTIPCQIEDATTFGQGSLQPNLATFAPGSTGFVDPRLLQAGREQLEGEKVLNAWQLSKGGSTPPPIKITPEGVIYDGNSRARAAAMRGEEVPYQVIDLHTRGAGPVLERPLFWRNGEPGSLPWVERPSLWSRLGAFARRAIPWFEE